GEPYFIKGARTLRTRYMDKVAAYGGNSVRIGYHEDVIEVLDEAQRLNLTVLFGLPVRAERDGFDYGDPQAVREQYEKMKEIVQSHKDHPAILAWAIGNELDHIPGDLDYNLSMWDAVNEIARMIHEADPDHPVMTVIGRGKNEKLKDLIERCPDLDVLGINAYADIWEIPGWLREYQWNKPYAVTEWGPSGHWQVPRTKWGVVIEETSTEKAMVYKERYENLILADPWCVGSYVFLWTSNRQERTHTWYNMFHDDGSEKEAVEVMHYEWTGKWPENRSPVIDSLQIDGLNALDNVSLEPGSLYEARVYARDPDHDSLKIEWELVPENKNFGAYAGQGETKPPAVERAVRDKKENGRSIKFEVPLEKGSNLRLFVYVFDGHKNVAVANIPFHIQENMDDP
ncbi:MAG: hypothetical protein KFF73_05230, partial [Cyclobacteriaceae bacterium]|nr:hypothetical protein [Cyclobacteriaceae bacterium]